MNLTPGVLKNKKTKLFKDLGMSIKVPAHNVKVKLYKHVTPDALVAQLLHSEIESNLNPRTDKVVIYSRNIQ